MYLYKRGKIYHCDFTIKKKRIRFSTGTNIKKLARQYAEKMYHDKFREIVLGEKKYAEFNLEMIFGQYLSSNDFKNLSKIRKYQNTLSIDVCIKYFKDKDFSLINFYKFINFIRETRQLKDNSLVKYIVSIKTSI